MPAGEVVCPLSGTIFGNESTAGDEEQFHKGYFNDPRCKVKFGFIQQQASFAATEEAGQQREHAVILDKTTAAGIIRTLLFSGKRQELRERYQRDVCDAAAKQAYEYIRRRTVAGRMNIDILPLIHILMVKSTEELIQRRAYYPPPTGRDATHLIDLISITAAHLWHRFIHDHAHVIFTRGYKYEAHVQVVLFAMIQGIPDILQSIPILKHIAPQESDLDKFGFEKNKLTRGDSSFRLLLLKCQKSNVILFFVFFLCSHIVCACVYIYSEMKHPWSVYVLRSLKPGFQVRSTYIGKAESLKGQPPWESVMRRLHQHNNTKSGATTTKSMRPLECTFFVTGFTTNKQADHFERAAKEQSPHVYGLSRIQRKFKWVLHVLSRGYWYDPSVDATQIPLQLYILGSPTEFFPQWTQSLPSTVSVVFPSSSSSEQEMSQEDDEQTLGEALKSTAADATESEATKPVEEKKSPIKKSKVPHPPPPPPTEDAKKAATTTTKLGSKIISVTTAAEPATIVVDSLKEEPAKTELIFQGSKKRKRGETKAPTPDEEEEEEDDDGKEGEEEPDAVVEEEKEKPKPKGKGKKAAEVEEEEEEKEPKAKAKPKGKGKGKKPKPQEEEEEDANEPEEPPKKKAKTATSATPARRGRPPGTKNSDSKGKKKSPAKPRKKQQPAEQEVVYSNQHIDSQFGIFPTADALAVPKVRNDLANAALNIPGGRDGMRWIMMALKHLKPEHYQKIDAIPPVPAGDWIASVGPENMLTVLNFLRDFDETLYKSVNVMPVADLQRSMVDMATSGLLFQKPKPA